MKPETHLHRAIHPTKLDPVGAMDYLAFRPTSADEDQLSLYDGDRITAEAAWRHRTRDGALSHGIGTVTAAEATSAGTPARPDPEAFPEHVLADFSALAGRKAKQRAAATLCEFANARGWSFRPDA